MCLYYTIYNNHHHHNLFLVTLAREQLKLARHPGHLDEAPDLGAGSGQERRPASCLNGLLLLV